MTYLVYARKYRPSTFDEIVGQSAVVQTLKNAISGNRVAQAYIFSGMRGVGKTTTARIMAKALNCQKGPTTEPCNQCEFCRAVNEDRSVDVLEIDGASNRGIDEVRSLREGVQYKPIHSRYKVIIIDEVHMLTTQAFNALLKTLEEPPSHTVFIFATTEFHKVPATIVSRCQHFEFKKISKKDMVKHLLDITQKENVTISSQGLDLIAEAAEGSLRDAQSLLDQSVAFSGEVIKDEDLQEILGTVDRKFLFSVSSAIMKGKTKDIFSLVEDIIKNGHDIRFFYKELIKHFRMGLLVKTLNDPREIAPLSSEELEDYQSMVESTTEENILRYLVALQEAESGLRYSSHPRITLETLLVKLCHFKNLIPLNRIIEEMEKSKKDGGEPEPERRKNREGYSVSQPPEKYDATKPGKTSDEQKASESSVKNKERSKSLRGKEADAALKDPSVQFFMDTFKARILSVEPVKPKEENS